MPVFSTELVLLIGLGVGVDYALFIVSRHRQGSARRARRRTSVVARASTPPGRAVLFAGTIVCVALLGMFALGISFLYGLAVAASIGVLFTMVAALTLLARDARVHRPRVLSRRQRRTLATEGRDGSAPRTGSGFAGPELVEARPCVFGGIGSARPPGVGRAVPAASARFLRQGNDAVGSTTRTAYDLLAQGFGPGSTARCSVVAETNGPARRDAMTQLATTIRRSPGSRP